MVVEQIGGKIDLSSTLVETMSADMVEALATQIDGARQLRFTDSLDMQTQKIINVVDPTANQEAATKKYVDDNAGGVTGIITVLHESNPTTLGSGASTNTGGSSPAESQAVRTFVDGTTQYRDYYCSLQHYGGGGLTVFLPWTATGSTGVVRWEVGVRRMNAGENITTSHSYNYNTVDSTVPTTTSVIKYEAIDFTDGVDMDSWADDEHAIVRVRRVPSAPTDTSVYTAELIGMYGTEASGQAAP